MAKYDFGKIEKKWLKVWAAKNIYEPDLKRPKKPFYNLMMFPYPSAEGLHIGGVRTFTGVDIYGRFKRMQGYDVFEPIGLDGFGINAENYALKIGKHPLQHAKDSEKNFYRQLAMIGNGFSWKERLETYDPDYYKWTQWIFAQMFKWGLAYRKKQAVNWCPQDKTVLADEQVIGGKCERCGSVAEKKELEQWFFRITEYANRLDRNLDKLDWSPFVKTAQRNWIGKSEGAEIDFQLKQSSWSVKVFTTRADTLFGATYLVLAPEHPLLSSLRTRITNLAEVDAYLEKTSRKSESERVEAKEKSGVELQGVKAINPANREEIPIWVADYVLGGYGTGAIMAVPAHDERDFEFAQKFGLPVRAVIEPVLGSPQENPQHKEKIVALVENKKGELLTINWGEKLGGRLFVGGTVEDGEDLAFTAKREVAEETGYTDLDLIRVAEEKVHYEYFAHSKGRPFIAHTKLFHFRLSSEKQAAPALEENEKHKFKVEWVSREVVRREVVDPLHRYAFDKFLDGKCYAGAGILISSDKFTGTDSEKAKDAILKFVGGKKKTQFRLRDWLLSRQRYWGAPIPLIHCAACAAAGRGERKDMPGWYAVRDVDLPVRLPNVKEFRPTGTDKSPLATVESFYKVRCPKCKAWARRETDVCDTFLDSSWYFLRYPSVNEKKKPWNPDLTRKWLPVASYIGGAEHSVLHLLYSRFLTMVFRDKKLVNFEEPFAQFRAHGLITKDGAKMSKSKGSVVNPDEYWKTYGTDVMRLYLAFMAPLDQGGDFRDAGIMGLQRFVDRILRLSENISGKKAGHPAFDQAVHRTAKKVKEDIESLHYNTAISALMILLNELETAPEKVSAANWSIFLRLLAPFAPFLSEELWAAAGNKTSIHRAPWPKHDPKLTVAENFTLVIQVNGKVKDTAEVPVGISEEEARDLALENEKIKTALGGAEPKRVIYVPNRLVNIVV